MARPDVDGHGWAMGLAFHHIAYETLHICNPVTWEAVAQALRLTDLRPGEAALDVGCGNATVAIGLAREFGLTVRAAELDARMAELAAQRIAASGQAVELIVNHASAVLGKPPLPRLITVMGATDAAAPGLRDPVEVFARMKAALAPGGWLLWGEPFWKAEPSAPLRQIIERTNSYQTDDGWRDAARAAGFQVVHVRHSGDAEWRDYIEGMDRAVRAWTRARPDAPETPGLLARADMQKAMFEAEGREVFGFGLYLLRAT